MIRLFSGGRGVGVSVLIVLIQSFYFLFIGGELSLVVDACIGYYCFFCWCVWLLYGLVVSI